MLFYKVIFNYSVYKKVSPLTHSLVTQHGPGDFTEDWVTNFDVQIGLEALIPIKDGVLRNFSLPSPPDNRRQKHISEHNSAPNCLRMKKLHMR